MANKKSIPVSLDEEVIEFAEKEAKENSRSRSGQINFMILWYKKFHEKVNN